MRGDQLSPRNHPRVTSLDQNTPAITQEVPSYLRSRVRKAGSKGKYWNKKLSNSSYHHLKGFRSSVPGTKAETSMYISYSLTPVQKKKKEVKPSFKNCYEFQDGRKVKVKVLAAQSHQTLCNPMVCPRNSPGKNTGVGRHSLLQGNLPDPGIEPGSLALQANSLPSELPNGRNRALNHSRVTGHASWPLL